MSSTPILQMVLRPPEIVKCWYDSTRRSYTGGRYLLAITAPATTAITSRFDTRKQNTTRAENTPSQGPLFKLMTSAVMRSGS